ncbi:hypothetical protein, partial [Arthrobacter bambusae]|uniref:hypothetical protein n=1 Tax=Arthrobacter bambusae TaxID=1338426 RepID=UPI00277F8C0D
MLLSVLLALTTTGLAPQRAAALDTSLPPSLMGFTRTSPASAQVGDVVSVDWQVADIPVTTVVFGFNDSLGRSHQVRWDNSSGALSGTATASIDSTWAAGTAQVANVAIYSANGFITYYPDGTFYKNPTGLSDPKPAILNFSAATLTIANVLDTSLPPSLMGFTRTSPASAQVGDVVSVDWQVADIP